MMAIGNKGICTVEEIMFGNQDKDIKEIIKSVKNKDMVFTILLLMIGMKECGKMVNSMVMVPFILMVKDLIMEDGWMAILI